MATEDPAESPASGAAPRDEAAAKDNAAREAGARPRRRPPATIDLAAKDLTPPEPAPDPAAETAPGTTEEAAQGAGDDTPPSSPPPENAPQEKPKRAPGLAATVAVALVSGLIGGAIMTMAAISYFGPSENIDALTDLEARVMELRQRTDALELRPQGADNGALAALGQRIDTLAATLDGVQGKVTALESAPPAPAPPPAEAQPAGPSPELTGRLEALEALAKQASTDASSAASQAASAAARPAVSPDALAAVSDKLGALEQRVEMVAKASEASAKGAAQLGALSALRGAVLRGAPFTTELSAARNLLGPGGDALQPLDAYAATGFPTGPALLKRLTAGETAPAAQQAVAPADQSGAGEGAEQGSDAGFLARLKRSAEGLVTIRRVETPGSAGADEAGEAAYGRVAAALQRDDLAGAAQEIEALPEKAREAAKPVIADIAARREALAAIDTLNRQILAGLAGSAP